jgi:two-component system cell cycle response regulator
MNSIIVVPIVKKESIIGTFFLRTASPLKHAITERVYKLCHLVANMSSNALENAALFESMLSKQRFLEEMILRDGLTALYNHQHFYTRIEEEFSRAVRYGASLSCLFFDIDNFKKINDRYGHVCGDEVLRQIGRMLNDLIRESDIAARYGGEEFAILLPNATTEGALDLANRLRTAIGEIVVAGMVGSKITVSIGIATYIDGNMHSYEQLIKEADGAMYQSKKMGKDRVTVAGRPAGLNP